MKKIIVLTLALCVIFASACVCEGENKEDKSHKTTETTILAEIIEFGYNHEVYYTSNTGLTGQNTRVVLLKTVDSGEYIEASCSLQEFGYCIERGIGAIVSIACVPYKSATIYRVNCG